MGGLAPGHAALPAARARRSQRLARRALARRAPLDVLAPLLRARFASCRAEGLRRRRARQRRRLRERQRLPAERRRPAALQPLGRRAPSHAQRLAVALKNDLDQARRARSRASTSRVLEQCFQYRECALARPFLRAGKGVYDAEYALPRAAFCAPARRLGVNAIRKQTSLGAWREPC